MEKERAGMKDVCRHLGKSLASLERGWALTNSNRNHPADSVPLLSLVCPSWDSNKQPNPEAERRLLAEEDANS